MDVFRASFRNVRLLSRSNRSIRVRTCVSGAGRRFAQATTSLYDSPPFATTTANAAARTFATYNKHTDTNNGANINNNANHPKVPSQIEVDLEKQFNKTMAKSKAPLFEDIATYKRSLPVRKQGSAGYLKLHTVPFLVRPADLTAMVEVLEAPAPGDARDSIKYAVAPPGAGKTASMLPAFLESARHGVPQQSFTHYLYLAFDNNDGRNFSLDPLEPSANTKVAVKQGAAFISECVRRLLGSPDAAGQDIPRDDEPPKTTETINNLRKHLLEQLGDDCRLLIHVDEHRKMCSQNPAIMEVTGKFRRGAMHALAAIENVTVAATYIEAPTEIDAIGSSGVCRDPFVLACADVTAAMAHLLPDVHFPINEFNGTEIRLLATLRFRFGMMLVQHKFMRQPHEAEFATFLKDFSTMYNTNARKESWETTLKACIDTIELDALKTPTVDSNAAMVGAHWVRC
jgi:hypothetical protein